MKVRKDYIDVWYYDDTQLMNLANAIAEEYKADLLNARPCKSDIFKEMKRQDECEKKAIMLATKDIQRYIKYTMKLRNLANSKI